ncbi:MAG TPA: glycosyltransferase family 4 protein [Longimicrobiaceae bacterium]
MPARPSVLFLNRFYWPDVAATGQMLTDLAEAVAAAGWEVTVVASRIGYAADGGDLPREETRNGVRILRVDTTRFGRDRLVGRMGDYLSYLAGASLRLLRLPRPDLVVAMSDPPFLLLPALAAGKVRGFRTVYWLQDLYPHLAARLGVLREAGLPYRALDALARRLHRASDLVVALGPRMAERVVASGGRPERTVWVHNWADEEAIRPVSAEDNPFLREHGLEGRFVVLYSGNAGRGHTFDAVLEAARRLRDDPGVAFVFIGGGKRLPEIRAAAERGGLANVRFLDYLPRERLHLSLSAASVSLVTEEPSVAGLLVPSKTYGILASGRPLLFVGSEESDVAAVVRETGCGFVVAPDDADGVVAAVRRLRDRPEEAAEMGRRAREAAERVYDRRGAARRWMRAVEPLLGARASTPAIDRAESRLIAPDRLS